MAETEEGIWKRGEGGSKKEQIIWKSNGERKLDDNLQVESGIERKVKECLYLLQLWAPLSPETTLLIKERTSRLYVNSTMVCYQVIRVYERRNSFFVALLHT